MPDAPGPRHPFCASPRSQNAHGHVKRAIFCGELQGICRTRMRPPPNEHRALTLTTLFGEFEIVGTCWDAKMAAWLTPKICGES